MGIDLAKSLAQIHYGNDFPAKIDDALDNVRGAGNRGDLRDTHNFAHRGDTHAIRFIADAKPYDLYVFFHPRSPALQGRASSAYSNSSSCDGSIERREAEASDRRERVWTERSRTKRSILSSRLRESLSICSAAAESSVELEADC